MFQIKFVVKNQNIHITYSDLFFPPENRTIYEKIPKDMLEPERTQTIWRLHVAFWISKLTRAKVHARDRAPTHRHTHTRGRTHEYAYPPPRARARARAHTHTHTHTETYNTSCFRKRASMLCYSYTASLVISVLPNTFRFTIRQSCYHETLYNMSYQNTR